MPIYPARKIYKSNWSVVGKTSSNKTERLHSFESTLERDFLTLLEFDESVDTFTEQPVTIPYTYVGKVRGYTPDFLVYYNKSVNRNSLLVEIKYLETLRQNALDYQPKFEAARTFCINNSFEFRVITEQDIRGIYLANCKFLKKYLYVKNINGSDNELLLSVIDTQQRSTPLQLITSCHASPLRQAELLHVLWHNIATRKIGCNWQQTITMSTAIWSISIK